MSSRPPKHLHLHGTGKAPTRHMVHGTRHPEYGTRNTGIRHPEHRTNQEDTAARLSSVPDTTPIVLKPAEGHLKTSTRKGKRGREQTHGAGHPKQNNTKCATQLDDPCRPDTYRVWGSGDWEHAVTTSRIASSNKASVTASGDETGAHPHPHSHPHTSIPPHTNPYAPKQTHTPTHPHTIVPELTACAHESTHKHQESA